MTWENYFDSNRAFMIYSNFVNQCGLTVGKQTHDLTVTASDSKTTQSGGDNRKKFPLGALYNSNKIFHSRDFYKIFIYFLQ